MKKSFMTRALATGLSLAMAFSLSAATNVTTAEAASLMKASSKTVTEGKTAKAYMTSSMAKKYRIKSHKESTVAKKYISVAMMSSRKGLKITAKEGALAAANLEKKGVKVKINFVKASSAKAAKKATKIAKTANLKVVVKAKKAATKQISISNVTATKANELTVTFASAVKDTAAVTLSVKKGTAAVEIGTPVWAADKTSVVIPTVANMTKGTYTVTAKEGEVEVSGTAEVVAQYVKEIKILNQTALTGKKTATATEAGIAYVYYDVLDQYGESMKNSTTIEWNSSVKVWRNDKNLGKLSLERSDDKAFTYGEQIYVTGVYAKTGVSVNATLTVGATQALNSIEVKGFVKKGTSEIKTSLPSNFKDKEYYLVYSVMDQNGNAMNTAEYVAANEVTFISDNVLVVKELANPSDESHEALLTIGGVDYNAIFVTPGQNVNVGGEVNITAIANKTGNKTVLNVVVGDGQILKSFTMSQPDGVVADGESVEIPFVALDQNGEKITNFATLARQSEFNNLKLSCGTGNICLEEQDDGTAKLFWYDSEIAWASDSLNGVDRPISLTAVVVGGDSYNEMIYVSDKAYPVAIKDVDMKAAYLNAGEQKFTLSKFTFLDQYGRDMSKVEGHGWDKDADDKWIYDNGFFGNQNIISGSEFTNYTYGVKVEYKGDTSLVNDPSNTETDFRVSGAKNVITSVTGSTVLRFDDEAVDENKVSADATMKFTIARVDNTKANATFEDTSAVKNKTFNVVDIHKVTGFTVKDLKKFYVKTALTPRDNGVLGGVTDSTIKMAVDSAEFEDKYDEQKVELTATFNGASIDVPTNYYTVTGKKIGVKAVDGVVTTGAIGVNVVNEVTTDDQDAFAWSDLYDASSAKFVRKDANDTLTVKVYPYGDDTANMVDSATIKVTISDAKPAATTIKADDKYTFHPIATCLMRLDVNVVDWGNYAVDNNWLLDRAAATAFKKAYKEGGFVVEDQYGIDITDLADKTYKVSNIVENKDAYADNNFRVISNGNANANVEGAELGDTFTLTVSADYNGTVTKNITITVGSDDLAVITKNGNSYDDRDRNDTDSLVDVLEDQR